MFPRLWFNFGLNICTVNLKKISPNNGADFINKGKTPS
ncbi:hypothetical protein VC0395_0239 [Vibrio cholerae O395]|uniref:Uncharacterized protein n=1 Tax=Vibrio cholerae serotype O1 (strain ATCC 39541 / Classical Ogawa 395 / O395) TaxID=345073 RepID=A0A0H3AF65_VIBC3|nr:hypothetical protein VC0395_0239 [Vibrio cholerae O395]